MKTWAARPTGRCLACNQEIGVRFPGRSTGLMVQRDDTALAWRRSEFDSRWVHYIKKVAGYGWPDRGANAAPLCQGSGFESLAFRSRSDCGDGLGGEMDHHVPLLTGRSGFESWSRHRRINGGTSRLAPGIGWKPIGGFGPLRVQLPLLPLPDGEMEITSRS